MLKEHADGNSIEVEVMYGTTEKINLNSKLFFCSNPTPNFKTNGGISNRYKQLSLILLLKNITKTIIKKHYN